MVYLLEVDLSSFDILNQSTCNVCDFGLKACRDDMKSPRVCVRILSGLAGSSRGHSPHTLKQIQDLEQEFLES